MKITNMKGKSGKSILNQVIIVDSDVTLFQSYENVIVKIIYDPDYVYNQQTERQIYLDEKYWNYSKTTGKYRNQFLDENKAATEKKIKSGEYILTDLNK